MKHTIATDDPAHLDDQLARMVARGRITSDEANQVRASGDGPAREATIRAIQLRHARERAEAAVIEGRTSREDLDRALDGLAAGEDPAAIRHLLSHLPPTGGPRQSQSRRQR